MEEGNVSERNSTERGNSFFSDPRRSVEPLQKGGKGKMAGGQSSEIIPSYTRPASWTKRLPRCISTLLIWVVKAMWHSFPAGRKRTNPLPFDGRFLATHALPGDSHVISCGLEGLIKFWTMDADQSLSPLHDIEDGLDHPVSFLQAISAVGGLPALQLYLILTPR